MDGARFDDVVRRWAGHASRRQVAKGLAGGVVAGVAALLGRTGVDARRVTQAQCGNMVCADDPSVCHEDCVCCTFGNGNSRCMPPRDCQRAGGEGACTATPNGGDCTTNEECCSGICQGGSCVATIAGTCSPGISFCETNDNSACGNDHCGCMLTTTGSSICIGNGYCDVCENCPDGTICVPMQGDCSSCDEGQVYCVTPCTPLAQSCFTGDTLVAMADGTSRPIAAIAVGDAVLGRDGVNWVDAIERPRLGARRLYALNDSAFFVTAEHPFLTEAGWKAIDPAATAAENPDLIVGRLVVGDRLLARIAVTMPAAVAAGGVCAGEEATMPALEATPLHSIIGIPADPATPLYNLLLTGDHTYFANDLLVHNKG